MIANARAFDFAARAQSAAVTIAAAALLLCWPAVYNGYPLVYGDPAAYLETLALGEGRWARPAFYTVLLFPFDWRPWLWPVILAQAVIVAHLLHVVIRTICGTVAAGPYLGTVAVLAACSSLPWFASMLMPDIFVGVSVLGLYVLGFNLDRLGRAERWYIAALTAAAIASDLSHLGLAVGLVVVILALKPMVGGFRPAAVAFTVGPLLLAALVHTGANALARQGLTLASPVFQLARMIGDGTAQTYLRERCPQRPYVLCRYLDELPDDAGAFLRGPDSVFERAGGPALRTEAREIVAGVLSAYPAQQMQRISAGATREFFVLEAGGWLSVGDPADHPIGRHIRHFFPAEYPSYMASRQSTGRLPEVAITLWHVFFAVVGLAASAFLFLEFARRGDRMMVAMYLVIVAALIGNALIAGGLLGGHGRFQSRVVWLVVFYAVLAAQHLYLCDARRAQRHDA
jgi:hypothetical protein